MESEPTNNEVYPLDRQRLVQIKTAIKAAHRHSVARDESRGSESLQTAARSGMTILQAKALEILTGAIDGNIENATDLVDVEIHLSDKVVKFELHIDELENGFDHWACGSEKDATGDDRLKYVELKITRGVGQKKQ